MFVLVLLLGAASMLAAYIMQVLRVAQSARKLDLHSSAVTGAQTHVKPRTWTRTESVLWAARDR